MARRLTDLQRLYRLKSEAELVRDIIRQAKVLGWLVHHSRPALYGTGGRWATQVQGHVGLPDLICVRSPDLLLIECKREIGYDLTPEQERWRAALEGCPGVEYLVVRPSGFEDLCRRLAAPRGYHGSDGSPVAAGGADDPARSAMGRDRL